MDDQHINNNVNPGRSELGNLSIRDLFYKYVRFLPLFLLSLAISLLAAWVYLRYATRIYGSGGTMIIKNEAQARGGGGDRVEAMISGGNRSQNIMSEIEVLKSKPLMERVVNKLKLQLNYTAIGKIKEYNVYKQGPFIVEAIDVSNPELSTSFKITFINSQQFRINNETTVYSLGQRIQNQFGVFRVVGNSIATPGSEYRVDWAPAFLIAGMYASGVTVQPKTPGTGILSVGLQATNSQLAADIVNHLMVEYDSLTVEQNNSSIDQMLNFIDGRLRILNREIDSIQLILLTYQQKYNLVDIESQSGTYLEKIGEFDKTINEQRVSLNVVEMIDEYLRNKKNEFNKVVVPSSLGLGDPTLNTLVDGYNTAQLKRQSLIDGDVPPDNPVVKEVEGQIEKIRESVLENLNNIKSSLSSVITNIQKRNVIEQS